tara:strand:- start:35754 stop:36098 length:345 start_codon:yes stop_codon:yes gene_type:complete
MLDSVLVVFGIAALGGVLLALHVLRGKFAPWYLSIAHALLGATGLVLLATLVVKGTGGTLAMGVLGLFVVAALGGFYLAFSHLRKELPSGWLVVLHASLAVIAFGGLVAVVLNG